MLKTFTLLILINIVFLNGINAQPITRLVKYEEFTNDTFGAPLAYKAYWQNFSGARATAFSQMNLAGWTYYSLGFIDASAYDTLLSVDKLLGIGARTDSSMTVKMYDSANSTIITHFYLWDFTGSQWNSAHISKDSLDFTAGQQLVGSYNYVYDVATQSFQPFRNHTYSYNPGGKLSSDVIDYWDASQGVWHRVKNEYTWSGNDLISEIYYGWYSGGWVRSGHSRLTTYSGGKPQTHVDSFWSGSSLVSSEKDSNVYAGNTLTFRYMHSYEGGPGYYNYREGHKFNTNGTISQVITEMTDNAGTWGNHLKRDYIYDSYNNPLTIIDSAWVAGVWRALWYAPYVTNYYYNTTPVSVSTQAKSEFSIYPSPAAGSIHMKTAFKQETNCVIAIMDMQGRLQRQWTEMIKAGNSETTIPVGSLPNGNYFLKLLSAEESGVQSFNVMR